MSRSDSVQIVLIVGLLLASATAQGADQIAVRFVVIVPDVTADQPECIYLASSADDWKPDGRSLPRVAPGLYSAVFQLRSGTVLNYKFTRTGAWQSVEKSPAGQEVPNRTATIDPKLAEQVLVCMVPRWADRPPPDNRRVDLSGSPSTGTPMASTLTGDIRVHRAFHSPQLDNDRTIIVYLPPGYGARGEQYPVLYMQDGNNIFDAATAFTGVEWQADETAERLIKTGRLPKLIIVGVYNTPDRINEYAPWPDPAHNSGGKGDAYLAFIVETLKPFIDKTYRTRPEREHTAIAGSSMGGLISLYAAFKHPDVFSRAAVMSTPLNWADGAAFDYVSTHKPSEPIRLWVDVGTAEGLPARAPGVSSLIAGGRRLVTILEEQGYQSGRDFRYEEVARATHDETAWAARFDRVLLFLFGSE